MNDVPAKNAGMSPKSGIKLSVAVSKIKTCEPSYKIGICQKINRFITWCKPNGNKTENKNVYIIVEKACILDIDFIKRNRPYCNHGQIIAIKNAITIIELRTKMGTNLLPEKKDNDWGKLISEYLL